MRGVGGERDVDVVATVGREVPRITEVVFDVAVKVAVIVVGLAFELGENFFVRLAEDVGEGRQATTVGHADDDFADPVGGAVLNRRIEGSDEGFAAFEGEAFLAYEFLLQKLLEQCRLAQLLQNLLAIRRLEPRPIHELNRFPDPLLAVQLADVHVLNPDAVAVRLLEMRHDVAQLRRPDPDLIARLEHRIEVGIAQAEMAQGEVRCVRPAGAHRVRLGEEVTARPVAVNQVEDLKFLQRLRAGAVFAVVGQGQIKPPKKKPPTRVDGLGVLFELGVQMVERTGLGIAQEIMRVHVDWSARVRMHKDTTSIRERFR